MPRADLDLLDRVPPPAHRRPSIRPSHLAVAALVVLVLGAARIDLSRHLTAAHAVRTAESPW